MPRNLIGGILTILIGVGYLLMTLDLRASALDDTVGPAGFPKALAYALIVLGFLLCLQSVAAIILQRSQTLAAAAQTLPGADEARPSAVGSLHGILRAAGLLGLGIVYLLIVRWFGYLPSVALLMIATTVYLGTPFSLRVIAIGVAGATLYWAIFVWLLGIPLPSGILGGLL